jgi:hypothetical protein
MNGTLRALERRLLDLFAVDRMVRVGKATVEVGKVQRALSALVVDHSSSSTEHQQ